MLSLPSSNPTNQILQIKITKRENGVIAAIKAVKARYGSHSLSDFVGINEQIKKGAEKLPLNY
jgi:hypothetical protein